MSESDLVDTFLKYLFDEGIADGVAADIAAAIGEAVTGLTREQALALSREQAAVLVNNITEQMRDTMKAIITQALRDQVGVDELTRRLRDGLPLDPQRQDALSNYEQELQSQGVDPASQEFQDAVEQRRQELAKDRAQTIARTELAKAVESGEQEVATSRGANMKVWLTVSDGKVSDFCAACEAQGPIPIDEDFVGNGDFDPVQTAPGHPNCRCTVTYFTDTGKGETGRQAKLQKDRIASTQAARDAVDNADE